MIPWRRRRQFDRRALMRSAVFLTVLGLGAIACGLLFLVGYFRGGRVPGILAVLAGVWFVALVVRVLVGLRRDEYPEYVTKTDTTNNDISQTDS